MSPGRHTAAGGTEREAAKGAQAGADGADGISEGEALSEVKVTGIGR